MTPTDALIEKMARAIARARGIDPDVVFAINDGFDDMRRPEADNAIPAWMSYRSAARAAYEAEHEETKG